MNYIHIIFIHIRLHRINLRLIFLHTKAFIHIESYIHIFHQCTKHMLNNSISRSDQRTVLQGMNHFHLIGYCLPSEIDRSLLLALQQLNFRKRIRV